MLTQVNLEDPLVEGVFGWQSVFWLVRLLGIIAVEEFGNNEVDRDLGDGERVHDICAERIDFDRVLLGHSALDAMPL